MKISVRVVMMESGRVARSTAQGADVMWTNRLTIIAFYLYKYVSVRECIQSLFPTMPI